MFAKYRRRTYFSGIYILVVLIALFGELMRIVFGFGEALVTMPLLFVIVPLGNWISSKIDSAEFVKYVYAILIIFGLILLLK